VRLVFCVDQAAATAYDRIAADGVSVDERGAPPLRSVPGAAIWPRVRSGELALKTFSGVVTDVDPTFEDLDFTVTDSGGARHEFALPRGSGPITIGDQALVRYVEYPDATRRPNGSVRMITHKIEIWLGR
jgi:hypothetical protein